MAKLYDYETRERWLASRREFIGASEIPILFGIAPESWGSAFTLWLEKTGKTEREQKPGEWLKWGHKLEPLVAEEYAETTGRKLWDGGGPYVMAVDPQLDVLRCTPDRWIIEAEGKDGHGNLQLKTTCRFMGHKWDDGIPDTVRFQVQSELAATELTWGSAAVLEGGNRFRYYDFERDEEMIADIRAQVEWFWNFVKTNTAPPLDGFEATTRALKRLNPKDNGETVELPSEAAGWLQEFEDAKAAISDVKKREEERRDRAENKLRQAIGAATFGVLPDGRRLSLKTTDRNGYVVEPTSYRQLRVEKDGPPRERGRDARDLRRERARGRR